ncbi:pyridoxamine 5'-phosphate oxidase family protein [Streptomyces sp. DvalAA-14]|uniref:PPOX class F420-dependent oxidoreductase n=1 Tax=unclassified Streptomyces TaxID=2593676 RepID=UPI00081B98AA|nr:MULTISPECIES: PPOX class F420-dependent oxidoreductase [unclassified Streptomyces]MYS20709.1 PPOX class F420-dependent oxidoreductase [Streptomyces sp. SID4948]SCD75244.1 pyridoxamine 5'-phosphate oxidase family protein [Streptomyces sp. DvalAA-14]
MSLTETELAYVTSQFLGRLATVDGRGAPQNNPVSFRYNTELGTFDIGGRNLAESRKFKSILNNPHVAFVIDDLVTPRPWTVRGIEIRGIAEAISGQSPANPHFSGELIRIHPTRILSWGLDPETPGMQKRNVAANIPS